MPGGLIIRRFGDKNICAIGLALMASGGCVMGVSDCYGVAFGGRLASGMGATLFNLVLAKMATDWFARREIVLAMAVILSTWPFGIALGLFVEPRIAVAFGWRSVMLLAGVICLVSLLLVALFYRVPPAETEAASTCPGRGRAAVAHARAGGRGRHHVGFVQRRPGHLFQFRSLVSCGRRRLEHGQMPAR